MYSEESDTVAGGTSLVGEDCIVGRWKCEGLAFARRIR